jgi:hypothetical protein
MSAQAAYADGSRAVIRNLKQVTEGKVLYAVQPDKGGEMVNYLVSTKNNNMEIKGWKGEYPDNDKNLMVHIYDSGRAGFGDSGDESFKIPHKFSTGRNMMYSNRDKARANLTTATIAEKILKSNYKQLKR